MLQVITHHVMCSITRRITRILKCTFLLHTWIRQNSPKSPEGDGWSHFIIFHKSLSEGRLLTAWKIGNITPIYKKGIRSSSGNYRPVSLTFIIGKVMESIIRDHLVHHMMENQLFCDAQHGFVPGRSCMT